MSNFGKRIALLFTALTLVHCSKDSDDDWGGLAQSTDFQVKDFIWKSFNSFYLWQEEIPDLADTRFEASLLKTHAQSASYVSFLNQFDSPRALFQHLKYPQDRFSYLTEDYQELENYLEGISLSTGMYFELFRIDTEQVAGVVKYVLPNSDADTQGVKRGDIFLSVEGKKLTRQNYSELLFNNASELLLDFYRWEDKGFTFVTQKVIGQKVLQENPVLLHKIFNRSGKKIAYLLYNSFIADFDAELNRVFGEFKAQGAQELILDLRYNSGGSVRSAQRLASMITGAYTGQLFTRERCNPKLQKVWTDLDVNFVDRMNDTPLHSLNMQRLYVITSQRTASASELIINGLKPYINVVQIGEKTVGKNLASITVKDWIDAQGNVNPKHKWALQLIVIRSENKDGFGDYQDGILPQISISEKITHLGELGETSDPLLAKTLEQITGISSSSLYIGTQPHFPAFQSSKGASPLNNQMFILTTDFQK